MPPDGTEVVIKVRNILRACPYVNLELAAAMHGVEDIEMLIFQLMTIEDFRSGQ